MQLFLKLGRSQWPFHLIFAVIFTSCFGALAQAKTVEVEMRSISYFPKMVTIALGDSIVWKNVSYTDHSATGDAFDTGLVNPKKSSKAIVFSKTGNYSYHCQSHGKSMSASINVGSAQ